MHAGGTYIIVIAMAGFLRNQKSKHQVGATYLPQSANSPSPSRYRTMQKNPSRSAWSWPTNADTAQIHSRDPEHPELRRNDRRLPEEAIDNQRAEGCLWAGHPLLLLLGSSIRAEQSPMRFVPSFRRRFFQIKPEPGACEILPTLSRLL